MSKLHQPYVYIDVKQFGPESECLIVNQAKNIQISIKKQTDKQKTDTTWQASTKILYIKTIISSTQLKT